MSFGSGRISDRIGQITSIRAVTWCNGHKYTKTMRNPNMPIWEAFPPYDKNEILYEKKLWGWASFIDDKPKGPRVGLAQHREIKAGETVILCGKCANFHGAFDVCI